MAEEKAVKEEKKNNYGGNYSGTILLYLIAGSIGRWFLRVISFVPSVEPITALAVLAAVNYGATAGILVGAGGFVLSNILLNSFGNWTIFQVIAIAVPLIWIGTSYKNKKLNSTQFAWIVVLTTIVFEVIINLFFGENMGVELLNPVNFATALPFSFIHIISNAIIALLVYSFIKNK